VSDGAGSQKHTVCVRLPTLSQDHLRGAPNTEKWKHNPSDVGAQNQKKHVRQAVAVILPSLVVAILGKVKKRAIRHLPE